MLLLPTPVRATFSIIACDRETGSCGVAVATNNMAVGASVCYAKAGVGALVTQFETNPNYGSPGLRLLEQNIQVEEVLAQLLANDNNFEGLGISYRQVAVVNVAGSSTSYSGDRVLESTWAGSLEGAGYSIQGNGLVGEAVLVAMEEAFLQSDGSLANRLLAALVAGQHAGGQKTGQMSAALLVRTMDGWPLDIDLRVDADKNAVSKLESLFNLQHARQAIIRAERFARNDNIELVWPAVAEAVSLGHGWDRIWRRAARLAMQLDEHDRALEYLGAFYSLNPEWARLEMDDPLYAPLKSSSLFQHWQDKP